MKAYIKTALVLFLICGVCTALCALVNSVTAPVIAESERAKKEAALVSVSAGYGIGSTEAVGEKQINARTELTDNGKTAGYVLDLTAKGYGGDISIIAAYKNDGTLLGSKVVSDSETAGLGKKSEEDWYMEIFRGKGVSAPIPTSKSMLSSDDSDAVSGASVTFGAVSSALAAGSSYVKNLGGR